MKSIALSLPARLLTFCLLPLAATASVLEDAGPYLDLDGSFISVIDFDGDGQEIGEALNGLYGQYLASQPDVPPIPIDFPTVFETLGFGSMKAWAMSSKELEEDLVRNRSVSLLDGEPAGLILMYGLEPTTFRAATLAPADATTALSASIQFDVLRDTLEALLVQFMGPMGAGMAQNFTAMPIPGTDVTANEIIGGLSGAVDLIMKQDMRPDGQPEFSIWASFEGAGPLLERLQPLAASMPVRFTTDENGLVADFSGLLQGAPMGLYLAVEAGSDDLVLYTDPTWAASMGQPTGRLATQPQFTRLAAWLPADSAAYSYSAGFDPAELFAMLDGEEEIQPYLPLIRSAVDVFFGDILAPNASVYYRQGDALISEGYGQFTMKQVLMAAPLAVVGLAGGSALQAMQNVSAVSQEKAITNNLRQIASAAQQKMLDDGATEVTLDQIVGPGNYIESIESVAGESYDDIIVTASSRMIAVELPDGRLITYEF